MQGVSASTSGVRTVPFILAVSKYPTRTPNPFSTTYHVASFLRRDRRPGHHEDWIRIPMDDWRSRYNDYWFRDDLYVRHQFICRSLDWLPGKASHSYSISLR